MVDQVMDLGSSRSSNQSNTNHRRCHKWLVTPNRNHNCIRLALNTTVRKDLLRCLESPAL